MTVNFTYAHGHFQLTFQNTPDNYCKITLDGKDLIYRMLRILHLNVCLSCLCSISSK